LDVDKSVSGKVILRNLFDYLKATKYHVELISNFADDVYIKCKVNTSAESEKST